MALRLNLDAIQPDDIDLVFRDVTYKMPGTMPATLMVEMTKRFQEAKDLEADGDNHAAAEKVDAMRQILVGLVRERTPDAPDLPLSGIQVFTLMGVMTGVTAGSDWFEGALARAISADGEPDAAPFEPAKPSRKRSSRSAGSAATRRTTTAV